MELKVINNTNTVLSILAHPTTTAIKNFDYFGTHAHTKLMSNQKMYATIKPKFFIASMYQAPDQTICVTEKLTLEESTSYIIEEDGTIKASKITDKIISIKNACNKKRTILIYGAKTCILQKELLPDFTTNFKNLLDTLNNVIISISIEKNLPDFFPVEDENPLMFSLSSDELSLDSIEYVTFTINSNPSSGIIDISNPDYTPFATLNSKNTL